MEDYMKRMYAVFFALALLPCGVVFAGGSGQNAAQPVVSSGPADPFSPYQSPVTIGLVSSIDPNRSWSAGDSLDNNHLTRFYKDKLNVGIKYLWSASGADYDQKLNLSIASNNIPDAMVVSPTVLRQLVKTGQIQPLTKQFNDYASPFIKEIFAKTDGKALETVTFNGEIMGIPSVQVPGDGIHLMWIRKDWLDTYGLAVPRTPDELKNVLRVFVKNGKIGIAGQASAGRLYADFLNSSNNTYGLDPILEALGAYPGYWLDKGGQAVYGSIQAETKAVLAELRSMYAEGLIDKELGIRKDASETVISGQAGVTSFPWWFGYSPIPDILGNDPNANWQAYALLNKDGKWKPHMMTPSTHVLVVKKGYAYPEAAIKILNLHYDDLTRFNDVGPFPIGNPSYVVLSAPDALEYEVIAMREYLAGRKTIADYAKDFNFYTLLQGTLEGLKATKLPPYTNTDIQYWNPRDSSFPRSYSVMVGAGVLVDTPYDPVYSLTYSQTQTMESRWANLKKMEDETFLKIIIGQEPLSAFDTFVEQWKRQGGDLITGEVNADYRK
jgi:putative aldouronate transport system substrate-binding protein